MKKPAIKMNVIKEDSGYSAHAEIGNDLIGTQGETFQELTANVLEAVNLAFKGKRVSYTLDEINFQYDLESFFAFYKVINAKALSQRIGMNQSLLSQYIKGIKKPSTTQTRRILKGIQQLGKELADVSFLL